MSTNQHDLMVWHVNSPTLSHVMSTHFKLFMCHVMLFSVVHLKSFSHGNNRKTIFVTMVIFVMINVVKQTKTTWLGLGNDHGLG